MKPWLRKASTVSAYGILFLVVTAGVLVYVLFVRKPSIPDVSSTDFDLKEIRRLALSREGALPLRLNVLEITEAPFLRAFVFAGGGISDHMLYFSSI